MDASTVQGSRLLKHHLSPLHANSLISLAIGEALLLVRCNSQAQFLALYLNHSSVPPAPFQVYHNSQTSICSCWRCCLGIAVRAKMLKKSAWLLHPNGDKAPHTGKGSHSWCLTSSLSLSVGFSIQNEAMDVVRSAPQVLTTVRTLLVNKVGSKELIVFRVQPTSTRYPTNSLYTPTDNTPLHSISSVCHPWGKYLQLP